MTATRHRAPAARLRPALAAAIPLLLLAACTGVTRRAESPRPHGTADPAAPPVCAAVPAREPAAPPAPRCDDAALTGYDGLLVIAPHPDDEILGFAGLTAAYMEQGKPVAVIVTTDGDAYCEACQFWKNESVDGATCDAADLSNFSTSAVDSFAEVRRGESTAAAAVLGRAAPEFLGYPDTGLAAAWREAGLGRPSEPLHRSDFSACDGCGTCPGYGAGPESGLTPATLVGTLSERIGATSERTLLATTHPLDGHGDHAALGNFVKTLNDSLERPRPVVYAIIHAHTPKDTPAPDCWYPGPAAVTCACIDERCAGADPAWIAALRRYRFRPEWPDAFPDDVPYGEPRHLCLPEPMFRGDPDLGEPPVKLAAVEAFGSQLGTLARDGDLPGHLAGIVDCNGYLTSFVRRTEAFALSEPAAGACDPAGQWVGGGAAFGEDGGVIESRLRLTLASSDDGGFDGRLAWPEANGAWGSEPVGAERAEGCGVVFSVGEETWTGSISRDGASLYVHRDPEGGGAPGYWTLHRSI